MKEKVEEAVEEGCSSSPQRQSSRSNTPWRRQHGSKKTGKWTRSNKLIGPFKIDDAVRIASELTGDPDTDLRLPAWSEICQDWKRYDWLSASDVVYRRVLCLLCQQNIPQPAFTQHMQEEHPREHPDVYEVLRRMTDVRLSRFYANGAVYTEFLEEKFPEVPLNTLQSFLEQCGFVVTSAPEECPVKLDKRQRPVKKPDYPVDFASFRDEETIKTIPIQDAQDMATVLCEEGGALPELLFSSSFPTFVTAAGQVQVPFKRFYCYSCRVSIPENAIRIHLAKSVYHRNAKLSTPADQLPILKRLTEVRLWHYFSVNPIPLWKVEEVCKGDAPVVARLSAFLKDCGFAINMFSLVRPDEEWPVYLPNFVDDDISAVRASSVSPSDSEMPSSSDGDTMSISSGSISSSSTSSYSSRPDVPYYVMRFLPSDHRVEHAILDIESMMETDAEASLDQSQYMFVLGWCMYCLVVSNGCKLNVLCKLTVNDIANATEMKDDQVRSLLRYSTTSTASGSRFVNWVVVDNMTSRALQLYSIVRRRRMVELEAEEMCSHALCAFFLSYNLKSINGTDIVYPLVQFLRMCGVDWSFRAHHLSSAVGALVIRDNKKLTPDYALEFYKHLQTRADSQSKILGPAEDHHMIQGMSVNVAAKTRKDKGTIKGPQGPNRSSLQKFHRCRRGMIPEKDRLAKRLKRLQREDDMEWRERSRRKRSRTSYADYSSSSDESRESTPEGSLSPSRAFATTPSPERSTGMDQPLPLQPVKNYDDLSYL